MEKIHPLNEKLYIPRNIEGEINSEAIEVLRELDAKFKQYMWYIGVSLMGSTIRNYNLESSDIDCKLIYDSSKIIRSKVIESIKLHCAEIEKDHGFREGYISIAYVVGFNFEKMKKLAGGKWQDDIDTLLTIKDLTGILIGENTDKTREMIKNLLSELSSEEREKVKNLVVDFCVKEERLSEKKLSARIGMSEDEMIQLWKSRKELYGKRFDTVWS